MAHLRCDFFSETLALSTSMTVILPQATSTQIGMTGQAGTEPPPVLYLLHGLSDDHTIWLRRTSIERYVAPLGLAVVMPQVHRSFYVDEVYGGRYWTFLCEELPALVASFFRVSTRPEDTFVAGLSMGGYGALRWALKQPMRLGAAVSLSGAVNVAGCAPKTRGSSTESSAARRWRAASTTCSPCWTGPPRPTCRRFTCAAGPKIRSTPTTGPSKLPVPEPGYR
jgi:S-formylglutathione hydrolase FrmB